MKIYSFQHKDVLNELIRNGEYKCSFISNYRIQAPNLYKMLQECIYEKTKIDSFTIFGWSKIENIDDNSSIEDVIRNTCYRMPFRFNNNLILLELDVPNEYVVEHNFYDFSRFELDETYGLCYMDKLRNFIYKSNVDEDIVQASFPIIYKKWVKDIYTYSVNIIEDMGSDMIIVHAKKYE